jgi:DNA polymerase-1
MLPGTATGTFYLIDGHSLLFQVFHAIRGMSSPTGLPTNALFGFARDLLFLRSLHPDYLVCAFDRAEPTFRSAIYADYKAHRDEMPSDLQLQMPHLSRLLEALNVPAVSYAGFEADDVLATLARAGAARGLQVYLCTSDKDCRQLIGDHVQLYSLRKQQPFGKAELLADWGITPEQVVDLQTLVGDSVDNVPGVPGIGIKTAAKLLQDFGTIEQVLANIDQISGDKRRENLRAFIPEVEKTRRLVRLADDVPVPLDWDGWRLSDINVPAALALCREWGFHSLQGQIASAARLTPASVAATVAPGIDSGERSPQARGANDGAPISRQQELFANDELFPFGANAPTAVETGVPSQVSNGSWTGDYQLIDTPRKFQTFLAALRRQKRVAFDLETTSLQPLGAEIVGYAFSWHPGEAYYVAVRGPAGAKLLDPGSTLERLRGSFEDPAIAKVNQNIKYDLLVLRANGVEVRGVTGDPMVADYLLHAGERSHGMEDLSRRYLNHQVIPITDLIGKKTRKQAQLSMNEVSTDRVAEYAGEDADVAWRLAGLLEHQLVDKGGAALRRLYDQVEIPLIEVLAELEFNGIRLDVPLLQRLSIDMGREMAAIEKEIYDLAGHPFQIGSLAQLRTVLFDELKLPVQSRTGITGAPSTDHEALEKLAALEHAAARLPRKILEHRRIAKLKGTYVDALPGMIEPRTGRIHASFNQTVASTGRLSASDPNLQNIPVRREQGQQIRQAFIPEDGWVLLTADYSQIELRLLAHFSGDEELRRAFVEGRDVHTAVASQVFGIDEEAVTADMRRMAKTVNFGVIYGMSAVGLAQRLEISRDDAARFIFAYFARYPRVEEYQARLLEKCRREGFVGTILGRVRAFDRNAIRANSTFASRNQAEREAINMEVQGSAADLMKLAMLNVYRRLRREGLRSRMLLSVHDELVLEAPPAELATVAALVREEMTLPVAETLKLEVPLVVDVATGRNWLDVTPWEG